MKQKAVFFDRDGTLIREAQYLSELSDIRLFSDTADALARLKARGYFLAMVTNQSGVARGYFPESFVFEAFEHLNQLLSPFGATIDAMEYCPHHPDGQPPYNQACSCRKPQPEMIHRLAERFELDLGKSWVLGDKLCDVELGLKAHVRSGLVLTGYGAKVAEQVQQKHPQIPTFQSLTQFADHLLE